MKLHHFDRPIHFEWLSDDFKAQTGFDLASQVRVDTNNKVPMSFLEYLDGQRDQLASPSVADFTTPMAVINPVSVVNQNLGGMSHGDASHVLHLHNWIASGERVFCVTEGLTQALMATDFKVQAGDVRLPFLSVFMRWAGTGLAVYCDEDDTHLPLDGAYITRVGSDSAIRIMAVSHYEVTSRYGKGGNYFYVDVPMMPDDKEITHASLTADTRRIQSNQGMDTLESVWRLVVNSLLYVSSPDARQRLTPSARELLDNKVERMGVKKRQRAEREGKRSEREYILVGRGVEVRDEKGAGMSLTTRHMVRGHWRNQPWGPHRSLRRMKWIEPHWRGPDTAAAVHRKYMVTEEEK